MIACHNTKHLEVVVGSSKEREAVGSCCHEQIAGLGVQSAVFMLAERHLYACHNINTHVLQAKLLGLLSAGVCNAPEEDSRFGTQM